MRSIVLEVNGTTIDLLPIFGVIKWGLLWVAKQGSFIVDTHTYLLYFIYMHVQAHTILNKKYQPSLAGDFVITSIILMSSCGAFIF
jgi:hypothetical protein